MWWSESEGIVRSNLLATVTGGPREVGLVVTGIVWTGGALFLVIVGSPLSLFWTVIVVGVSGVAVGRLVFRYLAVKGSEAQRAKADAEYRANIEHETQRQLAEMREREARRR